jgi:FkbM family methyltransferase
MLLRRRRRAALDRALARDWPGGYVLCDDGDLVFVPRPMDFQGARILFYGPSAPPAALKFLPSGGVAIDVGANLGEWAVPMAKAVGASGHVLCFEPNPPVAEALARTLRINNLRQARVLQGALSSHASTAQLIVEIENSGRSRLGSPAAGERAVSVETRRLDDALAGLGLLRVDLIKIDVEGHERDVIEGASETLRRFGPAVVIESGHESAEDRRALADAVEQLGYEMICALHDYGALPCGLAEYRSAQGACAGSEPRNLLLLPRPDRKVG